MQQLIVCVLSGDETAGVFLCLVLLCRFDWKKPEPFNRYSRSEPQDIIIVCVYNCVCVCVCVFSPPSVALSEIHCIALSLLFHSSKTHLHSIYVSFKHHSVLGSTEK